MGLGPQPAFVQQALFGESRRLIDEARNTAPARRPKPGGPVPLAKNERELQNQLEAMLRERGIFVVRQRMDKRSTVVLGCPDLLFSVSGVPTAWEVKMPGKKPQPEQVKAMEQMTANGWKCSVVCSLEEGLRLLGEVVRPDSLA